MGVAEIPSTKNVNVDVADVHRGKGLGGCGLQNQVGRGHAGDISGALLNIPRRGFEADRAGRDRVGIGNIVRGSTSDQRQAVGRVNPSGAQLATTDADAVVRGLDPNPPGVPVIRGRYPADRQRRRAIGARVLYGNFTDIVHTGLTIHRDIQIPHIDQDRGGRPEDLVPIREVADLGERIQIRRASDTCRLNRARAVGRDRTRLRVDRDCPRAIAEAPCCKRRAYHVGVDRHVACGRREGDVPVAAGVDFFRDRDRSIGHHNDITAGGRQAVPSRTQYDRIRLVNHDVPGCRSRGDERVNGCLDISVSRCGTNPSNSAYRQHSGRDVKRVVSASIRHVGRSRGQGDCICTSGKPGHCDGSTDECYGIGKCHRVSIHVTSPISRPTDRDGCETILQSGNVRNTQRKSSRRTSP